MKQITRLIFEEVTMSDRHMSDGQINTEQIRLNWRLDGTEQIRLRFPYIHRDTTFINNEHIKTYVYPT